MRIRVLGPPEVIGDDGARRRLERKARDVLTVLALRAPATVGLDELTALLWDEPPATATRTIQSHVSRLRAALAPDGGALAGHGGSYALAGGLTDVAAVTGLRADARVLRRRGRPAEAARLLRDARALWRGDVQLPATVAANALAQRWAHERRSLTEEHLGAVVDGPAPGDAVAELRALTAAAPLDEPWWVLLVLALARSGRTPDALRAAHDARKELAEVGLSPGAALRRAEAAAVADPPAAALRQEEATALADPPAAATTDTGPSPSGARPAGASPAGGPPAAFAGGADFGPVRYARAAGGVNVAYRAFGEGPHELVVLNPGAVSVDALDGEPGVAAAFSALGERARVVTLDRRGLGLSDPAAPGAPPSLEDWVADVVAVLDATGTGTSPASRDSQARHPVVLANSDTGMVALALAAAHPDRLAGVVLVHAYARYVRAAGYPYGVDAETAAASSSDALEPEPGPGAFDPLAHIAPSVARDAGFRRWWEATGRRAASPATAASLHDAIYRYDVRPVLAAVDVPVLVAHRRSCASCDVGHARYLADNLRQARLVLLPGADELWFAGPQEPFLAELTAFLDAVS